MSRHLSAGFVTESLDEKLDLGLELKCQPAHLQKICAKLQGAKGYQKKGMVGRRE